MSEARFNIVFYGIIQPGKDRDTVLQNMAALFKTTPEKIKPYFSGDRRVIKSNIDDLAAEKYRVALENVGLVIKLEEAEAATASEPAESTPAENASNHSESAARQTEIDTGNISMAEVGADVIEHPVEVPAQPIADISAISMAEVGADIVENPVEASPQVIADISGIDMAEVGANIIENPVPVVAQEIEDINGISMAEPGADIIEHPRDKEAAPIPDISELSLE